MWICSIVIWTNLNSNAVHIDATQTGGPITVNWLGTYLISWKSSSEVGHHLICLFAQNVGLYIANSWRYEKSSFTHSFFLMLHLMSQAYFANRDILFMTIYSAYSWMCELMDIRKFMLSIGQMVPNECKWPIYVHCL